MTKKIRGASAPPCYYFKWSVTDNITSIINAPNPVAHAAAKISNMFIPPIVNGLLHLVGVS